jgi:phage baseplate assembly protein W
MAFRIPNRDPRDINARQAIGISIPFSSPSVFTQTFTTSDQIKSNLINYFLTNRGERVLNPNYGGNLRNTLFEQTSDETLSQLKSRIVNDLKNYFPRVNVVNLTISSIPDQNLINIKLFYNVFNSNEQELNINIETNAL